jgi:DNA replication and repair protein RecF
MRLTQLVLTNFRAFSRLDLPLPAGPILLHGDNAQGKTTILEAVYYLATSRSPHTASDRQLLNWYAVQPEDLVTVGRLTGLVQTGGESRPRHLEIRLIQEQGSRQNGPSFRREVLVNGVKVRMMDLLGNLNVVLFLPEDVALVSAPPAERRRYMDITLCQVDRQYCQALSRYNRVLAQRNALLRSLQEQHRRSDLDAQLAPWDQKLSELGATVMLCRAALTNDLESRAGQIHFYDLTGQSESLRLLYLPRLSPNNHASSFYRRNARNRSDLPPEIREAPPTEQEDTDWLLASSEEEVATQLRELLQESRPLELQRGVTLVGPHRDDLRFQVNGRDLSDYGSRGQQRTAVMALKLAEVEWMEAQTGERPVLLLDEVLAELDRTRRAYLLDRVADVEQAILTATDPSMFTDEFLVQATQLEVSNGQVTSRSMQDAT